MKKSISSTCRTCLKAIASVSVVTAPPALALADNTPQKVTKAVADYQACPEAGKMCGVCRFYIAPGATSPGHGVMRGGMMSGGMIMGDGMAGMMRACTCQLVEGEISPMGYCRFYATLSG